MVGVGGGVALCVMVTMGLLMTLHAEGAYLEVSRHPPTPPTCPARPSRVDKTVEKGEQGSDSVQYASITEGEKGRTGRSTVRASAIKHPVLASAVSHRPAMQVT